MKRLWFVVPVHQRLGLAAICLRQLRRTCDLLIADGVAASAVIIADRKNLADLKQLLGGRLGFATVQRDNSFLSRRFNDGIQLATDPDFNPHPADYVVPCGSDDWVDHRLFLNLPDTRTIIGFQRMSFVREDGSEMVTTTLEYTGGSGIRIIPRELVAALDYRPADEDRPRACDTSILTNLRIHHGDHLRVEHRHLHDQQIVDWKTPTRIQLNPYQSVKRHNSVAAGDPFVVLRDTYPEEAVDEMLAFYRSFQRPRRRAAA